MMRPGVGVVIVMLSGCFGGDGGGAPTVMGNLRFVQGGTGGPSASQFAPDTPASLTAGAGYLVSPRRGRITFTSVVFRDEAGRPLQASSEAGGDGLPFTDCVVTYDRAVASGSTLLDCPLEMPIGEVHQIAVHFDKDLELVVSDPVTGIYSDPDAPTLYTTTEPAGGAEFVPFTITIGDDNTSRATPIVFASPVTITEEAPPPLYITTDMLQTVGLVVDDGGETLTADPGNDPVAVFGGLSPGTSRFYSNAAQLESYQIGSVDNYHGMRVFYDDQDQPLWLFVDPLCGPTNSPSNVWASPPIGGTVGGFVGGWLGTDASGVMSWATLGTTFPEHTAYNVMVEASAIGESTTVNCKATTAPPEPADGMTYASGAPTLDVPDVSVTFTLLAE